MKITSVVARIPWVSILLLALLISNFMNMAEIRDLQAAVRQTAQKASDERMYTHARYLKEINGHLDAIENSTDCLRMVRPVWCR